MGSVVPGVVIETNGTATVTFKDHHMAMSLTVLPVTGGSQVTTSGEASSALSTRLEALWATVSPPKPQPPGEVPSAQVKEPPVAQAAAAEASPTKENTYGF